MNHLTPTPELSDGIYNVYLLPATTFVQRIIIHNKLTNSLYTESINLLIMELGEKITLKQEIQKIISNVKSIDIIK